MPIKGLAVLNAILSQLENTVPNYTCPAGIDDGKARCRNLIVKDGQHQTCPDHPNGEPLAMRPKKVILKFNLNEKWDERFNFVRRVRRTFEQAKQIGEKRAAEAAELGRDSLEIRQLVHPTIKQLIPESNDTGCLVFGAESLSGVDVTELARELINEGYQLTDVHRLFRSYKPPSRLVMTFEKGGESLNVRDWPYLRKFVRIYNELVQTSFGRMDIWCNPDQQGGMTHTVNCGERKDDQRSSFNLSFYGGDWFPEVIEWREEEVVETSETEQVTAG